MSTYAFLLLCLQAYLVQNVCSQCHGTRSLEIEVPRPACGNRAGIAAPAIGHFGLGSGWDVSNIGSTAAAYGGTGVGDVAVAGEMGVAGTTLVAGQVPILGAVGFEGIVPAAGAVIITGRCGCGCHGSSIY
ncbi:chorion class CA protein ERA.1-like [Melitaea cinxia]|uniref:chorion class CA protein ERA.1-like n=1 Tax=Melitaea cinxia TaxID=113334 RepID=UPI001E271900|nr:chorion class CA protein ERA.1-like [Melitaea cinxia]